jgi:hypothetical protein
MPNFVAVDKLEAECQALFSELAALQNKIREKVAFYADGKNLKGNELVGWLGEIYGKLLFDGTLVDDREEHDLVSGNGFRVSVKTRKGWSSGWKQTSAINIFSFDAMGYGYCLTKHTGLLILKRFHNE